MGSVVGTAANGVGSFLGNAFAAPFKALFDASCGGVCSGTWDVSCFIEHICVRSLARLFMVLVLGFIVLLFVYILCKLGIIKCIGKIVCKLAWGACSGSCRALRAPFCLLWRKLRNTKRVYRRRRRRDVEEGELSPSYADTGSSSYGGDHESVVAGRWREKSPPVWERRKDRLRRSLRLRRLSSKKERTTVRSYASGRRHRRVTKLRRAEVSSLHVHGSARQHGRARAHHACT